jgi:hypothetical protein
MRESQSDNAEDQSDSGVNQPKDSEHSDLAGVACQSKLEAGHWRHRRRYWPVALRANNLPLYQRSATTTAKHVASSLPNDKYAALTWNVPAG